MDQKEFWLEQSERNLSLLKETPFVGMEFVSEVLPFNLRANDPALSEEKLIFLNALEKMAARIAIQALSSLARDGDIDHLGGGLELIPSLLMTLAMVDYQKKHFTIEHAHTSIGYYSALAALGYLAPNRVINSFRRGLDMAGHVSWVPGGTEINGGRLGVVIPVAVGQALGLKARHGKEAAVFVHCGDAGWISGQALNGLIAASLHQAPIVFIMNRNGIQLSGTTAKITRKDPREIIEPLGIKIIEIESLHDKQAAFAAYKEGLERARQGEPSLIYPVGLKSNSQTKVTIQTFAKQHDILEECEIFAARHNQRLDQEIWIPGSLMSFRDTEAMLQCLFYVNNLPGGEAHHDGGMKGRNSEEVLAGKMLSLTQAEEAAIKSLQKSERQKVITRARPQSGEINLTVGENDLKEITLPDIAKPISPRAGSEMAYDLLAKKYPKDIFLVSCDLDPSTKLGKAAARLEPQNKFELGIQEQVAALIANGLSLSSRQPQLNVFATFAAFFEGIAREGFEFWRYQRNLTGKNEGLNVIMHLSHVGACTGRDHFSGWSLDWINLAIGYLPYLRKFYAPADARVAFLSVLDAASAYGGSIVAIPRDNLPILKKQGSDLPLWEKDSKFESYTSARLNKESEVAFLAIGAPAYLAIAASETLLQDKIASDVFVINSLPLPSDFFNEHLKKYKTVITIEDSLIGDEKSGLRGFAGLVSSNLANSGKYLKHIGISDPQVAPSDHFSVVWKHFGISEESLIRAAKKI
ncbi:MAG TPA: thiamine pyrophosphate-dependent enzyme [Oligoflexia bacterium]|nr:thiamine pyrophosphate-dependent enzyme [Oligoflexia bacterium]HMP27408.1 thiamine pyrophosphate-dependent enzyme [Oligoflexia bacterium]